MSKTEEHLTEEQKVAQVGQKIRQHSLFAVQVFQTIWDAQQEIEKFTGHYHGSDEKGFQPHETLKWNRFYDEAVALGWDLTPLMYDQLREGMFKYRRQYRRLTTKLGEA